MLKNIMDELVFQLRWLLMNPRKRYAYLWARTREAEAYQPARRRI